MVATVRNLEDFTLTDVDRSRLHVMILDVTESEDEVKVKAQEAIGVWGHVDFVVNNAGVTLPCVLEEGGSKAALAQFQTNVFGVMNVTNAFLPHMRDRRSGTIIQMGSRSVWKADTRLLGMYAASKAAVHAYTETLAAELVEFGIRVLLVVPGLFRTATRTADFAYERLPAYDSLRDGDEAMLRQAWRHITGDPRKAMELVVDVVRGEGKAEGKDFPLWLILGRATHAHLRAHCDMLRRSMDTWVDVARDLDFDEAGDA